MHQWCPIFVSNECKYFVYPVSFFCYLLGNFPVLIWGHLLFFFSSLSYIAVLVFWSPRILTALYTIWDLLRKLYSFLGIYLYLGGLLTLKVLSDSHLMPDQLVMLLLRRVITHSSGNGLNHNQLHTNQTLHWVWPRWSTAAFLKFSRNHKLIINSFCFYTSITEKQWSSGHMNSQHHSLPSLTNLLHIFT